MYKKNYTPQPSGIYSKYAKLVQHLKINQCNPQHQLVKEEKSYMVLSADEEKAFDEVQHHS